MQQEISKTQLYKDTIKKQEKVISKLEKLMETTLKDTQKARNSLLELEQLKTENINLQKQLKQIAYGPVNNEIRLEILMFANRKEKTVTLKNIEEKSADLKIS